MEGLWASCSHAATPPPCCGLAWYACAGFANPTCHPVVGCCCVQVVDSSSSMNTNRGGSGNLPDTFQNSVKGFLQTFSSMLQAQTGRFIEKQSNTSAPLVFFPLLRGMRQAGPKCHFGMRSRQCN
jgi:hypothetical protein